MSLLEQIKSWFAGEQPLAPGMYQYRTPPDAENRFRLHLRVEPDGTGILVVNASKVLQLNQSATEMAKLILEETPPGEAARQIARRCRIRREQAQADYVKLREKI